MKASAGRPMTFVDFNTRAVRVAQMDGLCHRTFGSPLGHLMMPASRQPVLRLACGVRGEHWNGVGRPNHFGKRLTAPRRGT